MVCPNHPLTGDKALTHSSLLFLISAVLQLLLGKHHQKEKRYGPGPSNNYSTGTGRKPLFGRKKAKTGIVDAGHVDTHAHPDSTRDVELGTTPVATRPSGDTATTIVAPGTAYGGPENKYDVHHSNRNSAGPGHHGTPAGYVEPPHHGQHMHRGPDVQAQSAFQEVPGTHVEPAQHGISRYEAEKYNEPLHM